MEKANALNIHNGVLLSQREKKIKSCHFQKTNVRLEGTIVSKRRETQKDECSMCPLV